MGSIAQSSKILVTGANGYVGSQIVKALLEAGYYVKAAVRSQSAVDTVIKSNPGFQDKISSTIVPDITASGAYDEAVKGVDGVIHSASPFSYSLNDPEHEILIPAINGTTNILEAVSKSGPSVSRVVITSSFAAICDLSKAFRPGYTYTEADWNPETYEAAKTSSWGVAYCASKALAERAAYDYVKQKKPHFSITTLCPPKIFGPTATSTLSASSLPISAKEVYDLINGSSTNVPPTNFWAWVDVRDIALAHVRALETPQAANERFFITAGRYSYQQICDVLRASSKIPEDVKAKIPVGTPGEGYPGPEIYEVDNSKSRKVLKLEYRSLEASLVEAALDLIQKV
ncbi:hypothetical protein F5884DRAFT_831092 [Xylogone sp. PMI_703]|nr:hypothetical protein F5884DRAFT_831092 [Xylogone sp. PMI_703]